MKAHSQAWRERRWHSIRRQAFTLIEVLVVVAIIALLISILLPSLRKARELAKATACQANLHDFGTSLHTYAHESPPYFPPTPYMGSETTSALGDDNLFVLWYRKYTKDVSIYNCPATSFRLRTPERVEKVPTTWGIRYDIYTAGQLRSDFAWTAQSASRGGFGTSYEYNLWYFRSNRDTRVTWYHAQGPFSVEGQLMKTTAMRLPSPARAILMHDQDDGPDVVGARGAAKNNFPEPWDNHGSAGMNILFADGHSNFFRKSDFMPPDVESKPWRQQNMP